MELVFLHDPLSLAVADNKSRSDRVLSERMSEREGERENVSSLDLLTIKSIGQLTESLEKQWVISKFYA